VIGSKDNREGRGGLRIGVSLPRDWKLEYTGWAAADALPSMGEARALLAAGKAPVGMVVEPHDISLEQVGDARPQLAGGQLAGKVMVVPS